MKNERKDIRPFFPSDRKKSFVSEVYKLRRHPKCTWQSSSTKRTTEKIVHEKIKSPWSFFPFSTSVSHRNRKKKSTCWSAVRCASAVSLRVWWPAWRHPYLSFISRSIANISFLFLHVLLFSRSLPLSIASSTIPPPPTGLFLHTSLGGKRDGARGPDVSASRRLASQTEPFVTCGHGERWPFDHC